MLLEYNTIQYNRNNNGKPSPDDVVLNVYSTYDHNSFDPFSLISCPMMFVHPIRCYDGNDIEIAALVKLQIFTRLV